MSFDWTDYLQFAEALALNPALPGPEEAALRSAVSRAYYAAYCCARDLAAGRRELTPARLSSDHTLIIDHFRLDSNPTRRQIGTYLGRLRNNRNRADYDGTLRGAPAELALSSVQLARDILTGLSSL
jgi:uncharacterized protein (UPF0332 family)